MVSLLLVKVCRLCDYLCLSVCLSVGVVVCQEFLTIDVNNVSMPAMRWLPADTSVSSYPTLFYAYNGPLSQSVIATYPLSGTRNRWHTQLIGQYGFQVELSSP